MVFLVISHHFQFPLPRREMAASKIYCNINFLTISRPGSNSVFPPTDLALTGLNESVAHIGKTVLVMDTRPLSDSQKQIQTLVRPF